MPNINKNLPIHHSQNSTTVAQDPYNAIDPKGDSSGDPYFNGRIPMSAQEISEHFDTSVPD